MKLLLSKRLDFIEFIGWNKASWLVCCAACGCNNPLGGANTLDTTFGRNSVPRETVCCIFDFVDGTTVGLNVGFAVGPAVGDLVGVGDGTTLGLSVGLCEG